MKTKLLFLMLVGFSFSQVAQAQLGWAYTNGDRTISLYTNCEAGGEIPYAIDIDATELCEAYHMEITISYSCPGISEQLSLLGWTVTNLGIKLGYRATTSVAGGDSFSIPLNIPCDCHIHFTVDAVPNFTEPFLPSCEPTSHGSIHIYPF